MTKEWPQENPRTTIVRISDPAMEWHEVDLNVLLDCCQRELEARERFYPWRVANGKLKEDKAEAEIELMRSVCDFLTHCVFKALTRQAKAS
jgi:hypothetical protein